MACQMPWCRFYHALRHVAQGHLATTSRAQLRWDEPVLKVHDPKGEPCSSGHALVTFTYPCWRSFWVRETTGRQSPSLFDKWHGIFYMPSRIDEAGHTKAFDYPVAEHWGESRNVQFRGWDSNRQHIGTESNALPTEPPRFPRRIT